jgi:hypothetical protein
MVVFKLTDDMEVVPGSFGGLSNYKPSHPSIIEQGNRGLRLEWKNPIHQLKIKQSWEVTFNIRSFKTHPGSEGMPVNDPAQSYIKYDRYDGSPGGNDPIDALRVVVLGNDPRPPFTPPGSPTGLNASAKGSAITLSWSTPIHDGGAPILGYDIYRSTVPMRETYYYRMGTNSTDFVDVGIEPGVTYFYRVTALNAIGKGRWSDEANATLPIRDNPNATYSIRVHARDALTSEPVISASIHVDPGAQFALTDASGNGEIKEFLDGAYTITISAPGYQDQTLTIDVRGSDTEVYFYLMKEVEGSAGGPSVQMGPLPVIMVLSTMLALELGLFVSLVRNKNRGGAIWPT